MAEQVTTQEQKYTKTVTAIEALNMLGGNGSAPDAGMDHLSDEQVCTVVFGAIRDGAPKNMALDEWALRRFTKIYAKNETVFDQLVIQPAYEAGVLIGPLFRAVQREIQKGLAQRELPHPQAATDLLGKQLPPLRYFVQDLLAEGLTILAGKPKKGKSYLALDMSLALSVGREAFMKFPTEKSRVLYVSLEDGERRLQRRLWQIQPNLTSPHNLHFLYEFPRLGDGALEAIQYYAKTFQVIVIDTLGRILPPETPARKSLSEYQTMTDVLGGIQTFAQTNRIAVVVIDHVRKASTEDDGDGIIGSIGKFGAADHALIYGRKGEEKDGVLKVISRDIEGEKFVLSMVNGHLEFLGKGEVYEMDSEQNHIIKILEEEGRPMAIPDIMRALGIAGDAHYKRFRVVMHRLYSEDRVGRTKRGLYRLYGSYEEDNFP